MRWEPKKPQATGVQPKGSIDGREKEDKVDVLGRSVGEDQAVELQRSKGEQKEGGASVSAGTQVDSEETEKEEEACGFVADNEVIGREENMQVLNKVNAWVERCSKGMDGDFVATAVIIQKIYQKRMRDKYRAAEFSGSDAEKLVVDTGHMPEGSKAVRIEELDRDALKKASVSLMKKLSRWENNKENEVTAREGQVGKSQSERGKDHKQAQVGTNERRFTRSVLKQSHI